MTGTEYDDGKRESDGDADAMGDDGPAARVHDYVGGLMARATEMRLGTLAIHGDRAALFAALARAQAGYHAIPRSRTVKVPGKDGKLGYEFNYAPLEEVLTATLPSLNENGLALLSVMGDPEGQDAETELHTLLTHESGAFIHTCERLAHVDKPQDRGSQITYRRRYMTGCLTGTSPEFDDDGNQGGATVQNREVRRSPPPPPAKVSVKPVVEEHPHAPPGHDVLQKTTDIASKRADQSAEKYQAMGNELARAATAGMSPEQKATFMGPTVFTPESVPTRSVVNDEPLSEDMAMRLKGEFVRCGWGRTKVEVKLVEICGEGKTRANLTAEDGEKLMAAMAKEANKS